MGGGGWQGDVCEEVGDGKGMDVRSWEVGDGKGMYVRSWEVGDGEGSGVRGRCSLLVSNMQCTSGTDLLRQSYVLPHWDRSCRSNFLPHPVTVY